MWHFSAWCEGFHKRFHICSVLKRKENLSHALLRYTNQKWSGNSCFLFTIPTSTCLEGNSLDWVMAVVLQIFSGMGIQPLAASWMPKWALLLSVHAYDTKILGVFWVGVPNAVNAGSLSRSPLPVSHAVQTHLLLSGGEEAPATSTVPEKQEKTGHCIKWWIVWLVEEMQKTPPSWRHVSEKESKFLPTYLKKRMFLADEISN